MPRALGGEWEARREAWASADHRDPDAAGPGLAIFAGLARHLERA